MPDPKVTKLDKTEILYDAVSKDYDIGTSDEFRAKMANPEKRKAFYDGVGEEFELGTFEEFESKVTPVKKKEESELITTNQNAGSLDYGQPQGSDSPESQPEETLETAASKVTPEEPDFLINRVGEKVPIDEEIASIYDDYKGAFANITDKEDKHKMRVDFLSELPEEKREKLNQFAVQNYVSLETQNQNLMKESNVLDEKAKSVLKKAKNYKLNYDKMLEAGVDVPKEYIDEWQENGKEYSAIYEEIKGNIQEFNENTGDLGSFEEEISYLKRNYGTLQSLKDLAAVGMSSMISGYMEGQVLMDEVIPDWMQFKPEGYDEGIKELGATAKTLREGEKQFQEKMKPQMSVSDISWKEPSTLGFWAMEQVASQVPVLAALGVSGGTAGLSTLGVSAAGSKKGELKDAKAAGQNNLTDIQMNTASIAFGGFEVLSERVTFGIGGRAWKSLVGDEATDLAKQGAKQFLKSTFRTGAEDSLKEGGSEALNTFAGNIVDVYYLGDKEKKLSDGVLDAFASGGFIGGALATAPSATGRALSTFNTKKGKTKAAENHDKLKQIESELKNNLEVSPEAKVELQKKAASLHKENAEIMQEAIKNVESKTGAELKEISDVDKKISKIVETSKAIQEDTTLSPEAKDLIINDKNAEFTKLSEKKEELINKKPSNEQKQETAQEGSKPTVETTTPKSENKQESAKSTSSESNLNNQNEGTTKETQENFTISEETTSEDTQQEVGAETTNPRNENLKTENNENVQEQQTEQPEVEVNGQKQESIETTSDQQKQGQKTIAPIASKSFSKTYSTSDKANAKSYTVSHDGKGKLDIVDDKGNVPSKPTMTKMRENYAREFDYSQGEKAAMPKGVSDPSFNPNKIIAEKSNNPAEVLQAINEVNQSYFKDENIDYKTRAIADAAPRNIERGSYINFGDKNNINLNLSKTFFAKKGTGKSIDTLAQELSEDTGVEITPQDVVDFMDNYNTGKDGLLSEFKAEHDLPLRNKFTKLTGLPSTDKYIKIASEKAMAQENLTEYKTANDYLSEQELLSLSEETDIFNTQQNENNSKGLSNAIGNESSTIPKSSPKDESRSRVQGEGNQDGRKQQSPKKQKLTPIPKEQADRLITQLQKAIPVEVIRDSDAFAREAKAIDDKTQLQIFPYKGVTKNKALESQFNKANDLFKTGVPLTKIWEQTGFHLRQDTNDKSWEWAYRIDGGQMSIRKSVGSLSKYSNLPNQYRSYLKLSELIKYPKFFESFPDAKNLKIVVINEKKGDNKDLEIAFEESKNSIFLNLANYKTEIQTKDLLHEIQHKIQAATEQGGGITKGEAEARAVAINRSYDESLQNSKKLEDINEINEEKRDFERSKEGFLSDLYFRNEGEREAFFSETDFNKNPYEFEAEYSKETGIPPVDTEILTRNLREKGIVQKLETPNGELYGFYNPDTGKIHIDPNKLNANTPIHEFGHIWVNALKVQNKELYDKGIELVKNSEYYTQLKENPAYKDRTKDEILEEALVTAIGDKGESFVKSTSKNKFQRFLQKMKAFIGNTFFKDMKSNIDTLNLDQFLDGALYDLLGGKNLNIPTTKKEKLAAKLTGQNLRDSSLSDGGAVINTKSYKEKAKKFWNRLYKSNAGTPKDIARIIRSLSGEMSARTAVIEGEAATLKDIAKSISKLDKSKLNERLISVNEYLAGETDFLTGEKTANVSFLNKDQIDSLDVLRGRIDQTSTMLQNRMAKQLSDLETRQKDYNEGSLQYINIEGSIERTKDVIRTIEGNKGKYLARSYDAFLNDTYLDNLTSKNPNREGQRRLNNAAQYLVDNAQDLYDKPLSMEDAEAQVIDYLNGLKGSNDFVSHVTTGSANAPFLKKRKDIPKPFRELLGESKDPILNYVSTVFKISKYLANLEYQDNLGKHLIDTGIGQYKPKKGYETLTSNSDSWVGLSGIHIPKELKESIEGMQPLKGVQDGLMKAWIGFAAVTKVGKTVLSPTTAARNFYSGVFLGANAGFFFASSPKKMSTAFNTAWGTTKSKTDLKDLSFRLNQLGVTGDGAISGEILATMNDFSNDYNQLVKTNKLKQAFKAINKVYALGDDFYKVIGFLTHKDRYVESGMSEADAEVKAAERIADTFPTYSRLPRYVQKLRRFPIVGSFVSFPYEVMRTTGNTVKYMREDWKAGNKSMFYKQLAGTIVANSTLLGIAAISRSMMGLSDEEDDVIRDGLAEWQKNSSLIYLGTDKNGQPQFIDGTALFPAEVYIKPLRAIIEERSSRSVTDKLKSGLSEFVSPYIGWDIATKTAIEIGMNRDNYGREIYEGEGFLEGVVNDPLKVLNYGFKQAGAGVYNNINEFAKANNVAPSVFGDKVSPYGREYNNIDATMALFGIRMSTINYASSVSFYAQGINRKESGERSEATKAIKSTRKLSTEEVNDIVTEHVESHNENMDRILISINGARKLKTSESKIFDALKLSGLSIGSINTLMKGNIPSIKPISNTSKKKHIAKLNLNQKDANQKKELVSNYNSNVSLFNKSTGGGNSAPSKNKRSRPARPTRSKPNRPPRPSR